MWGYNYYGGLGQNDTVYRSSPVQVGSDTTWGINFATINNASTLAVKTDGTLWAWGDNGYGFLGQNQPPSSARSSPVQIPGTTWANVVASWNGSVKATKTDGTLWSWGYNFRGQLGQNQSHDQLSMISSPIQIPGTTWPTDARKMTVNAFIKTDGTWWGLGDNSRGQFAQNNNTEYSSPVQLPGTDWQYISGNMTSKTDGTLWGWGQNQGGQVGDNTSVWKSSPVQVPGTWDLSKSFGHGVIGAFKDI